MMLIKKLKIILSGFCIELICIITSFLSYCLSQVIGPYFVPLTVIPVFVYALGAHNPAPGIVAITAGITDDIFLNLPLGTFPFIYIILSYTTILYEKNIKSKRLACVILVCILIVINKLLL
ncbi:MAG: hypothetical protein LBJ92_01855 [Holosporales bacterium]|nr:hypothetical protein [Holosporales bacterium]